MEPSRGNPLVRLTATFEGSPITVVDREGDPLFISQQFAGPLGYPEPARFTQAITSEYNLEEGRHFLKFTNGNLAALKAALGPDVIDPRTPSLVLLTEAGLYRALMRSRAKNAEPFQEWLASEVLPQLRKTGSYALTDAAPAPSMTTVRFAFLRELHERGSLTPAGYAAELGTLLKSDGAAPLREAMVDELVQLAIPARSGAPVRQITERPPVPPEHADRTPIARLRLRHGLSVSGAAAKCGLNPNTWSAYEQGYRDPRATTLKRILDGLEATPQERADVNDWIGRGGS